MSFVNTISHHVRPYAKLMRMDKPIGTLLLLWPTLWGLWVAAKGFPDTKVLTIFVIGVVLMRAAGCIINDIADRHIDGHVQRTQSRPLVTGDVSLISAIVLFPLLCSISFILVLQLNTLTVALAIIAVILSSIYPFMKRYTYLPQFFLGFSWYLCIPMGFAAQLNRVPAIAWVLYIAAVLWTVAYDTMYAMVDREDDLKIGVKSTAILFGSKDKLYIGILQTCVVGLFLLIGYIESMNVFYYMAIILGAGFFVYQQLLIRQRQKSKCLQGFLNNNWFGMIVFLGFLLGYSLH